MNTILTEHIYTPEDLLTVPDADRYELVDGRLVESDMGAEASWVAGELHALLRDFCCANRSGWALPETSYQCFPESRKMVRRPDVSFIRPGRLPDEQLPLGHIRIAPDLAVEVVSPNDTYYEVEQKVREYLQAGVRLVWVVNPDTRTVRVHRVNRMLTDIQEEEELTGEELLPEFRCRVGDIFPSPRPAERAG